MSKRIAFLGPSQSYRLIIFSVCRRDIIGSTTVTSIAIGGIGVVIAIGTGMIGIEITPAIIGVVESFTGRQQFTVVQIFTERLIFIEKPMSTVAQMCIERLRFIERSMFTTMFIVVPTFTGVQMFIERQMLTEKSMDTERLTVQARNSAGGESIPDK